jgi:nucleotide-binding universal stress UspA family protein
MGKKILLPTDFSDDSLASALYAAHLSKALKKPIDIAHVTEVVSGAGVFQEGDQLAKNLLRTKLYELSQKMEAAVGTELEFDTLLLYGTTTTALASIAEEYAFVVMSAKGEDDLDRFFLGSTTKYMVQQNIVPVVVVPPHFEFSPLQKIVWALDDQHISTSNQIQPLPQIARAFSAHLEIFHHDEGEFDEGLRLDLAIFLENLDYSLHVDFSSGQITETILDFAQSENADLICMIHHRRPLLLKLFNPSKTLSSISKSKRPLLILPEKEHSDD